MKLILLLLMLINFSFATDLEIKITNLLLDWDVAHNDKNFGLYDKLYSDKVNYYNSKNFTKMQILEDKIRILKKYPDFKQISVITSKEEISDQIIKVNYEKNTSYSGKNKTYNSYLILNYKNQQVKIVEENDNKTAPKNKTDVAENNTSDKKNNIKNENLSKRNSIFTNDKKWEDLISKDIESWNKINCSPSHAKELAKTEKIAFEKLGLTVSESIKWFEIIGCNYLEGKVLLNEGIINPNEAKKWVYLKKYKDVHTWSWQKNGFSPEKALEWRDARIVNVEDMEKLKLLNVNSPNEVIEWIKTKSVREIEDIRDFKNLNINTPKEVIEWKETGLIRGIGDITYLKRININTPKEAIEWKKVGAKNTNDILNFNRAGLKNVNEVLKWQETKLTISEIKQLIEINVTSEYVNNNSIIKSMLKTNMRDSFLSSKESLDKYIKILSNNECKSIEPIYFDVADEYDNKGLCYFFSGVMSYRLNKEEGFISARNGVFSHINFYDSWPESEGGRGIIKGQGNYEYKDSLGNMRFTRNGTVIILER